MSGLDQRTVAGVFWSYLSFLGTKGINLAALILLARLLGPGEFGLMALCTVVIAYFEIVAKFGLGAALVSAQEDQPEMEAAVAIMSLVASALMVAVAWAMAPLIATAFGAEALTWPFRVIALALFIDAVAVVPTSLLAKRLQFRRKAVPDLARSLVKALASILLALAGLGVWALVWGHVLGTAAASVAAFAIAPWRPTARPGRQVIVRAFRFGRHLILAEAINAAQRNLDALLVGKLMGATALGIYTLAYRMPDLVIRSFNQVTGSVLHPALSARSAGREALASAYLTSLRHVALVTFPAGAALAVAAGPIVHLLYTPEWEGVIAPMRALSVALALLTIDFVPGILYKAMNRTELLLWTSLLKLPLFVAVLVLAAPFGVEAVALAQIGLSLFYILPNGLILRRLLPIGFAATGAALFPALTLAVATGGVGLILLRLPVEAALAQVLILGAGFAAVFLPGVLWAVPELRRGLRRRLKRAPSGGDKGESG